MSWPISSKNSARYEASCPVTPVMALSWPTIPPEVTSALLLWLPSHASLLGDSQHSGVGRLAERLRVHIQNFEPGTTRRLIKEAQPHGAGRLRHAFRLSNEVYTTLCELIASAVDNHR